MNKEEKIVFFDWMRKKFKIKNNPPIIDFPIIYNGIYWAFLGDNIGSEEGKHRPVLITRTYKNSPIITIIPLTTKRLNDKKDYHIDLHIINSTALCEQMKIIDKTRLDKPLRKSGKIIMLEEQDWILINEQIKKQFLLSPLTKK